MSRIQALEADIRRNAARLGGHRRTGSAAPTPTADHPEQPVGDPAAVKQSSVAAAMSSWRGSRGQSRTQSVRRGRSRALALMLDYRVPDLPMPLRQVTSMVRWATVATMMASWRDRTSHTVESYISGLGEPWISKLRSNSGLAGAEAPQLIATMGLQIETTQSNFTAERWESMLHEWGPLWVTADYNSAAGVQSVHAHILVGIHGPADGNPTVDVIDPAVGREVQLSLSELVARYEQLAGTQFAGLQIRHWPARAQQAAQQSMAWAQQTLTRHAAAQNAGAVVAAAGLLFQVHKELTTTNDLSWRKSELRGKVVPGNSEAKKPLADQGVYQEKKPRLKSLRRLTWDEFMWDDNVGAEFEISYEYNGSCLANVRLTNTSYAPPRPLSGRNLTVDTNITQSFANERDDIAAVEVEIVYQFTYARGSAGTFTQRYVLFGDGRQELFTETRS